MKIYYYSYHFPKIFSGWPLMTFDLHETQSGSCTHWRQPLYQIWTLFTWFSHITRYWHKSDLLHAWKSRFPVLPNMNKYAAYLVWWRLTFAVIMFPKNNRVLVLTEVNEYTKYELCGGCVFWGTVFTRLYMVFIYNFILTPKWLFTSTKK